MFWSAGCSHSRTEGFFFGLDVLYKGLGKGKLFLIKKKFTAVNFFQFLVIKNPGSGSVFSIKCLIAIRIRIKWIRIRNTALLTLLFSYSVYCCLLFEETIKGLTWKWAWCCSCGAWGWRRAGPWTWSRCRAGLVCSRPGTERIPAAMIPKP